MQLHDQIDRDVDRTPVELQVLDPWLRHRIAAVLQRAGVGPLDGTIGVTIRPGGAPGNNGHSIELTSDGQPEEPLLAQDPGRAAAIVDSLSELPMVARAAARLGNGARVQAIEGESSLLAAAVARRSRPADRRPALLHGLRLTVQVLEVALDGHDCVFVGDVDRAPSSVQGEIRRRLESPGVTGPIVVSSVSPLEEAVERGDLERELGSRLATTALRLEPIRKQRQELDELARTLLEHFSAQLDRPRVPAISSEAQAALHAHHWPGGVDELAAAIERAALLCDGERITRDDLPPTVGASGGSGSPFLPDDWADRSLREVRESAASAAERAYLDAVLRHTRGVIKEAAAMCGIGPRSLYDRMQQHALRKEDYKH